MPGSAPNAATLRGLISAALMVALKNARNKFEKEDCRRISVPFYSAAVIRSPVRHDLNARFEYARIICYLNVDRRVL